MVFTEYKWAVECWTRSRATLTIAIYYTHASSVYFGMLPHLNSWMIENIIIFFHFSVPYQHSCWMFESWNFPSLIFCYVLCVCVLCILFCFMGISLQNLVSISVASGVKNTWHRYLWFFLIHMYLFCALEPPMCCCQIQVCKVTLMLWKLCV
jgi:hypothetical protein